MLQMDDSKIIRRLYHTQEWTIRRIVRETGFSRQTVRKVLRGEHEGRYRMKAARAKPVIGEHVAAIREMLKAERDDKTRRKQRLTAQRIYKLLKKDGYAGSASTVRRTVREVRQELGLGKKEAFVPLEYEPGMDGQVDFFEADVELNGIRLTLSFLVLRACYSRRPFVARVAAENQESLFEALIEGFEYFGGVFHNLWFDNLTAAVNKILSGRARRVQERFARFEQHYVFEATFCAPAKGNEKGGVENGVGHVRRNTLSPVPKVRDLAEVDDLLREFMMAEDERVPARCTDTIGESWAMETPRLIPLPATPFDSSRPLTRKVDSRALVSVETHLYSVPVALVGQSVLVKIYAQHLEIHTLHERVARHPRLYGRNRSSFDLAHYLPLLEHKARAFDRAAPVRAAPATWPPTYHQLLRILREQEGAAQGTRSLIQVLRLHQDRCVEHVHRAVRQALTHEEPSVATVLAYLDLQRREENPPETIDGDVLERYPIVNVETGDVAQYDQLLKEVTQ